MSFLSFSCLISLCAFFAFAVDFVPNGETKNSSCAGCWGMHTTKGIMRWQSLIVKPVVHPTNKFHSCYELTCDGKHCPPKEDPESTIQFCYPAIIVTGLPKCGTSAMYDMLTRFPGAIVMHEKENCPYAKRRSHWQLFNSMVPMSEVKSGSVIVDGCIDTKANINIGILLRMPNTIYVVMVRDYADMMWSSYNFWCDRVYDGVHCNARHWVEPGVNIRSPQHFHDIVNGDFNGTAVASPLFIKKPCHSAAFYYSDYLKFQLWRHFNRSSSIVVASEELEADPAAVWVRLAHLLNAKQPFPVNPLLGNFTSIRVNSQDHKGGTEVVPLAAYRPGVYAVSNYKPMLPQTRELLQRCWQRDCAFVSQVSGHLYEACINVSLLLIRHGHWHDFQTIYKSAAHHRDADEFHDPID